MEIRSTIESWYALEIMVVSLEGTFNQVCLPDCFSANQKLKHIHEGIIQMSLEYWQAWSINHLSRMSVPVFVHPKGKDIFWMSSWNLPRCNFVLSLLREV